MNKPWTEEQTLLSRQMMARDAGNQEFVDAFGRNKKAVRVRLRYLDNAHVRAEHAARGAEYLRTSEKYRATLAGRITPARAVTPPEVVEDAIRRAAAPRSISAWICGDPPPGWSALERRA